MGFCTVSYASNIVNTDVNNTNKAVQENTDYANNVIHKIVDTVNSDTTENQVTEPAGIDNPPELFVKDNKVLEFYEGENVTKEDLLENIGVSDSEDGAELNTEDVRITSIEYSGGRLVDDEIQPSYLAEWENDVPEDFTLDTWPLQMQQGTEYIHNIVYEVTDSYGNTSTLPWNIKVKYNESPQLKGEDYYFTLKEAQTGAVTLDKLLENVRACDKEDCIDHCGDEITDVNTCLNSDIPCAFASEKIIILGFDAAKFKAYTNAGYETLSYFIVDQFGKETIRQFNVYIMESNEIVDISETKIVRSINKENYYKNLDYKVKELSEEEITALNQNGGLSIDSIWYTERDYRNLIQNVLDEDVEIKSQWVFSPEDIEWIRKYVHNQGIGNSKSETALSNFINLIQPYKQIK